MKTLLFVIPLLILSLSCSSSENTAHKGNIQIVTATYSEWSDPPPPNSDVPERGTDLSITVQRWSPEYTPEYIIYNNRKSLSATVNDSIDGNINITGRIIRASSRLSEISETVSKSNRLVYSNQEGEQFYIEIDNWKSLKN